MKIGLVDVDSHRFPNLALMKISAYHKNLGHSVSWATSLDHYDKIYMAKVFDFTKDDLFCYQAKEIVHGGTGYDLSSKLPIEIETTYPDYALYNIKDIAYGYLTRGCPRGCGFCIVGKKEGLASEKVADLNHFWRGQKNIKLLDPNLLASKESLPLLAQLMDSRSWVDFTQGLDIRLVNPVNINIITRIKLKNLHFAWDDINDNATLAMLKHFSGQFKLYKNHKVSVYVLTNFNSTHEQDLYRVNELRQMGYDPYIMIFNKNKAAQQTRLLQRYVNNKKIFRTISNFKDYDPTKG